ncbi:MAG: hypothetical protein WAN10_18945 [Candidatus Acidiferrales bacterium]
MQTHILNISSSRGFPPTEQRRAIKARGFYASMDGDAAHFITLSFWESRDAIVAFAGADIELAKYYPEDKKYLVEFEPKVTHYELFE